MVTVIIPTYKRAQYINRAIQSILDQTYKEVQIIVVDDNDPNTEYRTLLEKKMEKYKENKKVMYIQHEKNKNGAVARNTGIKQAIGEYITFLDDDDYFLPTRLEIMVNALENNKEYDCAYSSNIVTRGKKIIGSNEAIKSGDLKNELLLGSFSFGSGSNMFFRAEAMKKLNGFDESFQRHQDIETMLRYLKYGKILAIDKYLLVKTQDDRTNEPTIEKYISVKENYFKSFDKDIKELSKAEQNTFYKKNYMQLALCSLRQRRKNYYKKFMDKANEYEKLSFKDKLYILVLSLNNYIKIENIKYFIKKIQINMKVDKSVKKAIKYYENI